MRPVVAAFLFASSACAQITVGVLPFANLSNDSSLAWIGTGIAETMTDKLQNVKELSLVERARMQDLFGEMALGQSGLIDEKSAQQAGRMAGAKHLVIGSYQKAKREIRIAVKTVEVETGRVVEAASVTGRLRQIFALEDELALTIVEKLGVQLSNAERMRVSSHETESVEAYSWYSKSLEARSREQEEQLLAQAVELDGGYGKAKRRLDQLKKLLQEHKAYTDGKRISEAQKQAAALVNVTSPAGAAATLSDSIQFFSSRLQLINSYNQAGDKTKAYAVAAEMEALFPALDYAGFCSEPVTQMVDALFMNIVNLYFQNRDHTKALSLGEAFIRQRGDSDMAEAVRTIMNLSIQMLEQGDGGK